MASNWKEPAPWWKRAGRFLADRVRSNRSAPSAGTDDGRSIADQKQSGAAERPRRFGSIAVRWRHLTLQFRRAWWRLRRLVWSSSGRTGAAIVTLTPPVPQQTAERDAPAVAAGPAGSLVTGAFRDRRTALFTIATLTGGLALLLMLGWQVFDFVSDPSAKRNVKTQNDDDGQPSNPIGATSTPKDGDEVPPDKANRVNAAMTDRNSATPAARSSVAKSPRASQATDDPFGAAKDDRTVPGGTNAVPHHRSESHGPLAVSAPKVDPPETGSAASTDRSPFDDPSSETGPQGRFGNSLFDSPTMRGIAAPGGLSIGMVADAGPPLGLEIVRTSVLPVAPSDPPFLVTSVRANGDSAAASSRRRTGDELASTADGWRATRDGRMNHSPIVRARRGRSSSAGIPLMSSASLRWMVAAPKLKLDVMLPQRISAGARVPIRVRIVNVGAATVDGVTLHVDLPAGLAYHVGRRLSLDVGTLPPGGSHEARLTPVAVRPGDATVLATAVCTGHRVSRRQMRSVLPAATASRDRRPVGQ